MQLEQLGIQVSKLRQGIEDKAKAMMLAEDAAVNDLLASKNCSDDEYEKSAYELSNLAKKIKSREKYKARLIASRSTLDFTELVPPGIRSAVRKRKDLLAREVA